MAVDRPPLTSWKDISTYLGRSERTVQRWEKDEGLPVRRLPNSKSGTVFAYPDELDQWLRARLSEPPPEPTSEPAPDRVAEAHLHPPAHRRIRPWWIAAAAAAVIFGTGSILIYARSTYARTSHAGVQTVTLTSYSGTESCPTFSPDGKRVAFVWNSPGGSTLPQPNVYVMNVGDANPFRLTDQPEPEFSPVWSPDGKTIALMRLTGADQVSLVLKPVAGGAERIATSWRSPAVPFWEQATRIRHLDWTPDGGSLIVSAPPSDQAPDNSHNLFVLSLASGERRAITHAPPAQFDLLPAVSSDGRHVAFVRDTGVLASSLWIVDLGSGAEPRKVAIPGFEEVAITGVQWTPGGREVIFAADVTNLGMLWRTVPFSAQEPTRVEGVAFPVARNAFSISRNGGRLAYESRLIDMNVWTLDVAGRTPPQQVTQSTRIDYFGRFSPDGSRIVFASNQTGSFQIWICDRSGANAQMITHMDHGTSGAPVWSPDGKWIAFDSREGDNADLYKVAASGGPVIRLTDNPGADVTPSWSRDGRSIYFSSTRSGRTEIWKLPASGGAATQITRNGGTFPMVAPGGDRIFFIRSDHDYSVWSVPSDGGEDRRELDRVNNRGFVPARDGVFFVLDGKIRFRDFKSGRVREIAAPARRLLPILDLSPDGKTLSITQIDQMQQDLMLIDHLVW